MPWLIWSAAQTPLPSSLSLFPPSAKANVEQVWHTNPLKIPCGHVPKPNQFFFLFRSFALTPRLLRLPTPCPAPAPLCCFLFSLLAQHIRFYVNPCYLFESVSFSFSPRFRSRFVSPPPSFQLRQSGLWRRNHAPFQPAPTALAIIQNQSLWFWQLANFSLLYHINFMSLVFSALHRGRESSSRSLLSLSRTLRAAAL